MYGATIKTSWFNSASQPNFKSQSVYICPVALPTKN